MKPKTFEEMNKSIVGLLRFRGDHSSLYAAQRIEELEAQVEEMQKTLEAAYNIACEDFESVNQMELIRLTLGESLQSLKGAQQ